MEEEVETLPSMNGVWAFVLNQIVIETGLPYEFAPGCVIDKATKEQVERIKLTLSTHVSSSNWIRPSDFYECETICEKTETGEQFHSVSLPENGWRYYVVTTPDNGTINHNLHLTSNISSVPLEISGLNFFNNYGGQGWRAVILQNHFGRPFASPAKRVTREALDEIREIYLKSIEIGCETVGRTHFPEIQRAMQMYEALNFLTPNSDFHVLGLFAIIEMLITHNPKLEDRGDSITHQMQSKIPLLSRRFDRPLDLSTLFPNTTEKKIWTALYGYRSSLAHGGIPDFQSADLRILSSADNAKAFLRDTVKALLRHSLKEPQLYRDLRAC